MAKKTPKYGGGGREGGLCCDHCSDTKYPCALWEQRMRGERRGAVKPPAPKSDDARLGTEEYPITEQ